MHRLRATLDGLSVHYAGLPHFPRNFTRDSIVSALICGDPDLLGEQLGFCAGRQGCAADPRTGEEPGKIFHEWPGYPLRGLSTAYNACDTTALFLIGHAAYRRMGGDPALAETQAPALRKAVGYILAHLKDGLFLEDPGACGASRFALKVTYWKDSVVWARPDGEPDWPAAFTLAQAQNLCALRAARGLLGTRELDTPAQGMLAAMQELWDPSSGTLLMALDRKGPIRGVSSDALHALYYLEPGDLSSEQAGQIARSSEVLETPAGYRTLDPALAAHLKSGYHARTVWPFEQALLHAAALRFDLPHVAEVAGRVMPFLDTDPEILTLEDGEIRKGGCDPQLWTLAAKRYFGGLPGP